MIAVNDGHIVTVSSLAGKTPCPKLVDYCASKYAAVGLHDSLAIELRAMKKTGIQLTLVCPFFFNSGMFQGVSTRYVVPLFVTLSWKQHKLKIISSVSFIRLQPMLEQEQVAHRVVQATLRNEQEVVIPTVYNLLLRLSG